MLFELKSTVDFRNTPRQHDMIKRIYVDSTLVSSIFDGLNDQLVEEMEILLTNFTVTFPGICFFFLASFLSVSIITIQTRFPLISLTDYTTIYQLRWHDTI